MERSSGTAGAEPTPPSTVAPADRRVVLGCDDCEVVLELSSATTDFVHRVGRFFRQHAEHATSGRLPD
ncbi:MAG: hypothetical protein JWN57_2273 [Frankiales bacterium]|nr:hypothetical protein [Frankiales bacterium]